MINLEKLRTIILFAIFDFVVASLICYGMGVEIGCNFEFVVIYLLLGVKQH